MSNPLHETGAAGAGTFGDSSREAECTLASCTMTSANMRLMRTVGGAVND